MLDAELHFLIDPNWSVTFADAMLTAHQNGWTIVMRLDPALSWRLHGGETSGQGWVAPQYGPSDRGPIPARIGPDRHRPDTPHDDLVDADRARLDACTRTETSGGTMSNQPARGRETVRRTRSRPRQIGLTGLVMLCIGLVLGCTSMSSDARTSTTPKAKATKTSSKTTTTKRATTAKSSTTKAGSKSATTKAGVATGDANSPTAKTTATMPVGSPSATVASNTALSAKTTYRMIRPGAEGNNDLRAKTTALPTPGRIITASGSMADIQAKINALAPGDQLDILPGTYQGNLAIAVSGTAQKPIVIRSQTPKSVIFTGATSITVTGADVTVADIKFLETGTATFVLQGLRTKVLNNSFDGVGDGSNGASNGILVARNLTPGWPPVDVLNALTSAPLVLRNNVIAGNTFVRPKNPILWQDHGIVGNEFSFNTIDGPHGIQADFETEAIKIGYSFGKDQTRTRE